ncbi:MAG: S-methyl-5'-thioadenosine phosphorylase [Deltaproteobacteria bacterium]|nr:S-methyl-5'-thioadenosine phosphorylase [Deltaproteobacteria bacterium]
MSPASNPDSPKRPLAVIGGSGFYDLPGLEDRNEFTVDTPYGAPSDRLRTGVLQGRKVVFLARHGRSHSLLPSEVNFRANVYALKSLGVSQIISVSAVGSLREHIAPGDAVLPRQFIDRTEGRARTFFGGGAVAHVSLADPICEHVSEQLACSAEKIGQGSIHRGGTYLCIEGPQFSTRAESELWRQFGATVVGMTGMPEARLAREAEMCYATLALPSDYDCWRGNDDNVTGAAAFAMLKAQVDKTKRIVADALVSLDPGRQCRCHHALDEALFTPLEEMPTTTRQRLSVVLSGFVQRKGAGAA